MIVPLRVLAGGAVADDAPGALPGPIARELRRGERLSTARPAPGRFAAAYADAVAAGAPEIVSVHLSGELSGTIGSARLAARRGAGAGARGGLRIDRGRPGHHRRGRRPGRRGQPGTAVAQTAARRAARIGSFFALDSQEQLRAGGRLSPPGGAGPGRDPGAGGMMRSRPVLHIRDGRIVVLERVRTRSAAADRLTELAAGFAAGQRCEVVVQHLDSLAAAADLARQLAAAIPAAGDIRLVTAGTAIRAHTGPGLLGVVVAPLEHGPAGQPSLA